MFLSSGGGLNAASLNNLGGAPVNDSKTILQAHLGNNLSAVSFVAGNANVVNDTLGTGNWKFYVAPSTSIAAITGASNSTEWTVGNLLSYSSGSSPILNYSFDPSTKSGSTIKNLATNDYDLTLTNGATIKPRDLYSTQNAGSYIINGQTNPTLTFHRGYTYRIVTGHVNYPMYIQTVPAPYSSGNVYNTGVTNNGTGTLVITIVVTNDTPSTLYYTHAGGTIGTGSGTINIVASGEPDTVLSMNVSSGQYATSSVPLSFSQPWTISFVYQFTGTFNGDPTIFEIGNATGFGLRIAGGNSARSIISYQNGTVFSSQSYASSNSNSYNHYALVYNNGSFTGYFNATTSVTFQGSPQLNVVSDYTYINFGKSNMSSVTNPTTGTRVIEIDNFQIFNSALSLSDITALYNGTYVSPPPTLNDTTTSTTWMPTPGTLVDSTETLYTVKSNEVALTPGTNSTYAVWTATKSTNLKIDVSFADYNSRSANGVGFQMFKIKADNTFDSVLFPRTVTSTALTNANSSNYLTVSSINTTVNAGDKIYYRVDANGTTTSASSILATTIFTDAVSVATNPVENKLLQASLGNNLSTTSLVAGNANTVLDTLGSGDWKFYVAPSTSIEAISAASASSEWTGGSVLPYVLPPSVPTDMSIWSPFTTAVYDSVGNYPGTLMLGAKIAVDGGRVGGGGYLSLYNSATTPGTYFRFAPFSITTGGLSFAFWAKLDPASFASGGGRIFDIGNGETNRILLGRQVDGISFYVDAASGGWIYTPPTGTLYDNVWRHYAITIEYGGTGGAASTYKLYINGSIISSITTTKQYPQLGFRTNNNISTYANADGTDNGSRGIVGGIDDFQIFNRAIDATQVSNIYNNTTPPTDMIVSYNFNAVGIHSAILMNGATIATDGSPGPGQGYLSLTATSSQYATLPAFTTGTNGLSFACWFRSNATGNYARIFDFTNGKFINMILFGLNTNGFFIDVDNSLTDEYAKGDVGGISMNDNIWRHVVLIFHPTNGWTLYLNGVSYYTDALGPYPDAVSRTTNYIGKSIDTSPYYNGGIDDFRYYNRAITAEEVFLIYSQPAMYYPFDVADINPSITTQVGEYSTGSYVYSGTLVNNATIAVDGNSRVSGKGYLSLSSTSTQYVNLTLPISTGANGLSFAFWYRLDASLKNQRFFCFSNGFHLQEIMMGVDSTLASFVICANTNDTKMTSPIYNNNTWNHVVWTITPTSGTATWRIYVNGSITETKTLQQYPGELSTRVNNWIGRAWYTGTTNDVAYNGGIDDFRFYNRAITAEEVSALYAGPQPPALKDVGTGVTWIPKPAVAVDATETSYTVKSTEIALKPGTNSTYAVWTSPKSTNLKIDVSFADYHSRSTNGVGFQMFKINRDNTFGSVIFSRTTTASAITDATLLTGTASYLSVPSRTISVAAGDKVVYRIDGNGSPTLASSVLATNIYVDPNQDLKQNTILQAHLGNNLTATTFVAGNANIVNDTLGTGNWKFYVAPSTSIAAITGASNSTEWTVGNLLSYSLPSTPPVNYSIFYPFDSDSFSGTNVGNKATGSYVNDAVLTSSATISTSQYKYGTASLYLNNPTGGGSASQHLKLPTFTISQSTGFSVSLWVYNVRSALDVTFLFDFSTSGSGTGSNNMMLNLTGSNRYQFYSNYSSNSGGVITSDTSDVRKLNQWSHVCITINTSNFTTIYVDLVSVYSGTPAGSAFAGGAKTSAMLGATYFGNNSFYGYIDDFKIYNRPLTLAEVTALYTGPSPAKLSDTGATWMSAPGTPVDATETLYTVKSNEVALTPGTNSTYAVWTATKSTNLKIDVSFADYHSRSANGVGFQMFKIKSDNTFDSVLFPRTVTTTALTNANSSNYLTIPSINTTVNTGDKIYYRVDGNGISTSASSVLATAIYTDAVSTAVNPVETKLVQAQLATNLSNASLVAGNANTILDTAGAGDWKFYVAPSTSIAAISAASASSEWTGGSILPYVLPPSVPTDMSFCFTFNSNAVSGTTVSSSVGGYTGSLMNNAVIVTDGSPGPGNGYALLTKVNNSPSGYIVLPVLTFTTFGLTISMWFRATTNNVTFARLFDMYPFTIHINSSPDGIGFNGGGISNGTIYTGTVRDNVWRHLAVTITNSGASSAYKCYINGTLQQTTTSSYINLATTYQQSTIGTVKFFGGSGGDESFDGGIDDFRIYHRPITAEEVLLIYSQPAIYFPFDVADVSLSAPTKVGDLATGSYVYSGTLTAGSGSSSNATIVVDSRSRVSGKGYLSLVKTNKSFFNFTPFGVVTSGLTIAMWFRATTSNEFGRLFDMRNPEISLTVTSTALSLYVTPNTIFVYTFNFRDNVWRHVALTITYAGTSGGSSVYRLYVDGVVQRTSSPVAYPALGNRIFEGLPAYCLGTAVNGNSAAELFDGGIDDFRVYQRTLSPEEVTALYAGPQPPSLKDTVTGATWLTNPAIPVDATETSYTVKSNEIALKPGANSTYAIWTSPKTTNIRLDVSFADYHTRSTSGVGFQIFKINSDNTFGSVIFPRTTTVSALTDANSSNSSNYLTIPSTSLSVATGDKVVYRIDGNGAPTLASSVLATNIYSYSGRWT